MNKVRHVDFFFDEWLSGTHKLNYEERGVYITFCALRYGVDRPVSREELRAECPGHGRTFNRIVDALIDKQKIRVMSDGRLTNVRCETELKRARNRIETSQKNGKEHKGNGHSSEPAGSELGNATRIPSSEDKKEGKSSVRRKAPPKPASLKAEIKEQLRQKLIRFASAKLSGDELRQTIAGLSGADPERGDQWWLDKIDRRMRSERWDDRRGWKPTGLQRVA
jgi:uncharacterized protein YdaU (DUF1376 family)